MKGWVQSANQGDLNGYAGAAVGIGKMTGVPYCRKSKLVLTSCCFLKNISLAGVERFSDANVDQPRFGTYQTEYITGGDGAICWISSIKLR